MCFSLCKFHTQVKPLILAERSRVFRSRLKTAEKETSIHFCAVPADIGLPTFRPLAWLAIVCSCVCVFVEQALFVCIIF